MNDVHVNQNEWCSSHEWCPVMGPRGNLFSRDRFPTVNDANVNWFILFTLVYTWSLLDPSMKENDDHGFGPRLGVVPLWT